MDRLLGRGGMGEVYQAYDEKLERHVAIKLIRASVVRSDTLKHFLREARTAARLNHPAIVQIYHVEELEGDDCIVMELIDGRPLSTWTAEGPLAPADGVALALQIVDGLAEAHAKGIVHRDLKTENVMVTPDGRVKILDFGLAKPVPSIQTDSHSDMLIGTPRAMSPEQANELPVDGRSDLFSLGSLLYELATGKAPFRGRTPLAVLHQVCYHLPPPARELNPDVPAELSDLIGRLMEKRPEDRPRNAHEVRGALSAIAAGLGGRGLRPWSRPPVVHDERRQVTMMCCGLGVPRGDLVDASVLGSGFLSRAGELVQHHAGTVVKATSAELVACFGLPRAQGDDACRAVAAALAIRALFRARMEDRDRAEELRLAIHTGVADVLGRRSGSARAVGALRETADPWREANRLLAASEPGSIWISGATRALVGSHFECEQPAAGPAPEVFRVRGRFDRRGASPPAGGDSLVARREELELMEERWRLASEGRGQVMLVSGDAGIGKTRLVRAFAGRLGLGSGDAWWCRSTAEHQASAFRPVVALMWQVLATERGAPPEENRASLHELARCHALESHLPIWESLLGLAPAPPEGLDPRALHERTIESVLELLLSLASERPRLWVVEDLHWTDPATLELLDRLIDQVPTAGLLLLATFRSRFRSPWSARSYVSPLVLTGLPSRDSKELIRTRSGAVRLPDELVEKIAGLADGVPLYLEELTRLALNAEPGARERVEQLSVPLTLRDALMARLDRLGTTKQLAQLLAVFGRDFSHELLESVVPFDKETLGRDLDRLLEAELLYRRGVSKVWYHFRHALLRQAAYESLAEEERRRIHSVIAHALEDKFTETVLFRPEQLAHHYAEAGEPEAAARWRLRAHRT